MWRIVLKSSLFTIPVTVTVLDVFGYVAKVEGASMQVSLSLCSFSNRFPVPVPGSQHT